VALRVVRERPVTFARAVDEETSITTVAEVPIGVDAAIRMAEFVETRQSAGFLHICPSALSIACLQQNLFPDRQKGRIGSQFTCVGLVERAAEEAGINGGQGFVPNSREVIHIPVIGEVPLLSPQLLYWFSSGGFGLLNGRFMAGVLDPVDFVITDPLIPPRWERSMKSLGPCTLAPGTWSSL
jgi:hypothetical protein